MSVITNHAKQRLQAGQIATGFGLSRLRTVDAASIAHACGFHWLFIDLEHTSIDVDVASQISMAALNSGVTPLVRPSSKNPHHMTRLLDGGAMGVVVPHVDTPEEAEAIVAACKYPPVGHRSMYGVLPQLGFAALPAEQAIEILNDTIMVVVMIESPTAVANAEAIAAVAGVDGLLIGTSDLTAESGIPGQLDHDKIKAAYQSVIDACRKHRKIPGMGGVYSNPLLEHYIQMGMRMILAGSDVSFMMGAAKQRAEFIQNLET